MVAAQDRVDQACSPSTFEWGRERHALVDHRVRGMIAVIQLVHGADQQRVENLVLGFEWFPESLVDQVPIGHDVIIDEDDVLIVGSGNSGVSSGCRTRRFSESQDDRWYVEVLRGDDVCDDGFQG